MAKIRNASRKVPLKKRVQIELLSVELWIEPPNSVTAVDDEDAVWHGSLVYWIGGVLFQSTYCFSRDYLTLVVTETRRLTGDNKIVLGRIGLDVPMGLWTEVGDVTDFCYKVAIPFIEYHVAMILIAGQDGK